MSRLFPDLRSTQVLTTDSDEFWTDTAPLRLGGIPELQVFALLAGCGFWRPRARVLLLSRHRCFSSTAQRGLYHYAAMTVAKAVARHYVLFF